MQQSMQHGTKTRDRIAKTAKSSKSEMMNHLFADSSLDKIDIKILGILRDDARCPLHELASKCRISKQTALYRLNRLVKDNIIKGFHAKIDYAKLGYDVYYVFIQTRFIEDERSFVNDLSRLGGCIVITKSVTQYSYHVKLITKDIYKTSKELIEFFNRKKNVTSHFLIQRLERKKEAISLDDKDRRIIEALSIDCRQNSLELSRRLKLSYDIVHDRLRRLIKDKVLTHFTTMINFNRFGFMYYTILLKFADDQLDSLCIFDSMLSNDDLVVERYECIGEFGYIFEIVDKDYISINNKFNKIRSQFHNMIRNSQLVPIEDHYFYEVKLD